MTTTSTITIPVRADTEQCVAVLRIIAKHAEACASELDALKKATS